MKTRTRRLPKNVYRRGHSYYVDVRLNGKRIRRFAGSSAEEAEVRAARMLAEHVANAARLAKEGELANVTVHHASFAEFLQADVGEFDFVALHGVYSWVGPEVRREIQDILAKKLRPGGYAYLSYNALPGWAAMMPSDPWQSLDAFADMVGRYGEAGVNEFIIDQPGAEQLSMAERVATELLPKLRAQAAG